MTDLTYRWQDIEEELLDQFRLGQITKDEFAKLLHERLGYDRGEGERYADETVDFLEQMKQKDAATFSTGEWTSEMGDIVYPEDD